MSYVSFGPIAFNPSAHQDFMNLFANPELWPTARSRINALHVYYNDLLTPDQDAALAVPGGDPYPVYPRNLQGFIDYQAFSKMITWGLDWEVELWPLVLTNYRGNPVLPDQIQVALYNCENVAAQGGTIKAFRLIHGLNFGLTGFGGYTAQLYTIDEMADDVAALVNAVRAQYPLVQFGDQEPLQGQAPWFAPDLWTAPLWDQWLTALEARGVQLAFLDADSYDWPPGAYPNFATDYAACRAVCASHGVLFGSEVAAENYPYTNDQEYYTGTMAFLNSIKNAIGEPPRILFNAWDKPDIPLNLPETAPFSHTHLINAGLDLVMGQTPPVANFTASQVPSTLTMQFLDTST